MCVQFDSCAMCKMCESIPDEIFDWLTEKSKDPQAKFYTDLSAFCKVTGNFITIDSGSPFPCEYFEEDWYIGLAEENHDK